MEETLPVACTLDSRQMDDRRQEWELLLRANIVGREAVPGGVRLRLRRSDDVAAEIRRLIELERDCCRWIDWSIAGEEFVEVIATAATDSGSAVLREWFQVAREGVAAEGG